MRFVRRQLDNGLEIIGEINPAAQSAAVGFFVRTGARDETATISGVSHFLEHMLFKGTETLTTLQVNEAFDRLGAKFNAFTSEENTVYYAAVLPEYLPSVTELWCKLMRPALPQADFDLEKQVILEEIAMYQDMPDFLVFEAGRELFFNGHPCGNSVLGSTESIRQMTRQQMYEYFQNRYAPDNMVVACCGKVDFDAVCSVVEQRCRQWQPQKPARAYPPYQFKPQKRCQTKPRLNRCHMALYTPSVALQDDQWYAAKLLSIIVGDPTGSRYYWSFIEPALADTAMMELASMDRTGCWASYLCCEPAKQAIVQEKLDELFTQLKKQGITEQELQAACNKALSAVVLKSEQPMGRLVSVGFNWLYRKEYISVDQTIQHYRAVRCRDINCLLEQFDLGSYTQYILMPAME